MDVQLTQALVGLALAIGMLGAFESLLCSVVADGMARTATNTRSGVRSPIAAGLILKPGWPRVLHYFAIGRVGHWVC